MTWTWKTNHAAHRIQTMARTLPQDQSTPWPLGPTANTAGSKPVERIANVAQWCESWRTKKRMKTQNTPQPKHRKVREETLYGQDDCADSVGEKEDCTSSTLTRHGHIQAGRSSVQKSCKRYTSVPPPPPKKKKINKINPTGRRRKVKNYKKKEASSKPAHRDRMLWSSKLCLELQMTRR